MTAQTETNDKAQTAASAATPAINDELGALLVATGETRTWPVMKRIIKSYVRDHLGALSLAVLFMVLVAATEGATAYLLDPAIDLLFLEKDPSMLFVIPAAVMVVMIVKAAASYGQAVLMAGVGERIVSAIQIDLFNRFIIADLGWLLRVHTGKLMSSFLYDASVMRNTVSKSITGAASDVTKLIALIGVMVYQDWQLSIIALVIAPIVGGFIRNIGKRMRKAATSIQSETGNLATVLTETLGGVRTVKAYGREDFETNRLRTTVNRRLKFLIKAVRIRSGASPITEGFTGIAIAGVILFAGWKAQMGEMELNHFVSFLGAMMLAYRPLKNLATINAALQEGVAAAVRVFSLMDRPLKVQDAPDAIALEKVDGAIAFNNVAYTYDDGTVALNKIDLDIKPGQSVALVGPSGGGKSTVLNLIPRFFDATDGSITLDGQDLRALTQDSLRANIGLVSQDPFLFDDTIASNIAYSCPDATQDEIIAAAKGAAAHDFISQLPEGYQTTVGEAGEKLSGGQKQRIAIARAMLKDAPILLLDEATSALDTESERKVQDALDRLKTGRTTIMIAHRLSTIINADMICVVADGRIVEQGTHADLLEKGGLYKGLYETSN
ncbi:MAG: ABC transporter transmembrane domain-containing protein [Alphaproteobacteria bacterium]